MGLAKIPAQSNTINTKPVSGAVLLYLEKATNSHFWPPCLLCFQTYDLLPIQPDNFTLLMLQWFVAHSHHFGLVNLFHIYCATGARMKAAQRLRKCFHNFDDFLRWKFHSNKRSDVIFQIFGDPSSRVRLHGEDQQQRQIAAATEYEILCALHCHELFGHRGRRQPVCIFLEDSWRGKQVNHRLKR